MDKDTDTNLPQPHHHGAYEEAEPELNLQHYWHVILERRWLVVATFASLLALALIYVFKAPEIYQAETRLQIDREYQNILDNSQGFAVSSQEEDYLQTQYKNLQSRSLINTVVTNLNLSQDPRYSEAENITKAVKEDITVAPIRSSRLVDIKVEHTNPTTAKKIANNLVNTFVQNNLERRQEKSSARLDFLRARAETLEKELTAAKEAVQEYKKKHNMPSLERTENTISQALQTAQKELSKAETEAATKASLAQQVKQMLEEDTPIESIPRISTDERIIKMQSKLAEKKAELHGLLETYKSGHPEVAQLQKRIASLKDSIDGVAHQIYNTIQREAQIARATVKSLKKVVAQYEQQQLRLSELRIKFDVLQSNADRKKMLYEKLLQNMQETDITSKSKSNNMRVVDAAIAPHEPIKPRVALILLMGIVGGGAAGIGLALFVNYLDDSIKTQDDVETYLRLPFLGYIPHIKTNSIVERGLQAHVNPQSAVSESFRSLRAVVSLMPNADRYKVITVTSTTPSEGKSVVASNLGVVFAQTGLKTLLIDADLRRPAMHKAFRLHSPTGLASYLHEQTGSSDEIVQNTEVPNLDVICCGPPPKGPSELIASKRMKELIDYQRQFYDRILLDCAPVTAVADPLVVASRSDGILFVTKFNQIRRDHARKTVQRIQDAGIQILGVSLNDIDFEGKDSYYYYYYYYQNRYYSDYYRPSSEEGDREAAAKEG